MRRMMDKTNKPEPSKQIAMMLKGILTAEGEAIGCDDCFELLDQCAELVKAGHSLDELDPEVRKHLADCVCCSQELEALLTALGAPSSSGQLPTSG